MFVSWFFFFFNLSLKIVMDRIMSHSVHAVLQPSLYDRVCRQDTQHSDWLSQVNRIQNQRKMTNVTSSRKSKNVPPADNKGQAVVTQMYTVHLPHPQDRACQTQLMIMRQKFNHRKVRTKLTTVLYINHHSPQVVHPVLNYQQCTITPLVSFSSGLMLWEC